MTKTPTEPFTIVVHVLDDATDDQVQNARANALLSWPERAEVTGHTPTDGPVATFDEHAAPDSGHERAWVVTGPVTTP